MGDGGIAGLSNPDAGLAASAILACMYRDSIEGLRIRLVELRTRVALALSNRYGVQERALVAASLPRVERCDGTYGSAEVFLQLTQECDELERALHAFLVASERDAAAAVFFQPVGELTSDAELYTPDFARFLFSGIPFGFQRESVKNALQEAALHWYSQMPSDCFVDPWPNALRLFFSDREIPYKVELLALTNGEDGVPVNCTLYAVGPTLESPIRIRENRFGDDLKGLIGLGDSKVGHSEFDVIYHCSGTAAALHSAFTPAACAAFVAINRTRRAPTLSITDGLATLELGGLSLAEACGLMRAVNGRHS
jgi:hypothetical protein